MDHRKRTHLRFWLVLVITLAFSLLLSGCQGLFPAEVSPAQVEANSVSRAEPAPSKSTPVPDVPRQTFPATWTPTPTSVMNFPPTRTPFPTPNYAETRTAMTVIAEGISCKRSPDSWRVFVSPAIGIAGWCDVVGTSGTIYEYKLTAPDGWTVTTFGGIHPNLAFSTGYKNVSVRLYQSFSYLARSYDGTLEDAPEKAFYCDREDHCLGYISPFETLIRQEIKSSGDREILVLDSKSDAQMIRRYYQIIPFKTKKHDSQRLFILELRYLDSALDEATYTALLEKMDLINRSLWQR